MENKTFGQHGNIDVSGIGMIVKNKCVGCNADVVRKILVQNARCRNCDLKQKREYDKKRRTLFPEKIRANVFSVKIECEVCGKIRMETKYRIKQGYGRYCSRICFGIGNSKLRLTKDSLNALYCEQRLSTLDIAKIFGVEQSAISYKAKKLGVPLT